MPHWWRMQPTIELPPKLIPIFQGEARYRVAYGGRGSGKTRSFAKMAAVHAVRCAQAGRSGMILCVREFMNSLDDSSMAEVKAAIQSDPFLVTWFDISEKIIRTKDCGTGARVDFKFAGLNRNVDSVKSKSQILLCWADEAEPITETAWQKLIPTVREHESEIWVTWNPESKISATHERFRVKPPSGAKVAEINWRDNPKFPDVLEQERVDDLENRPEQYPHIWDGDFVTVVEGAYFAKGLSEARRDGRIGKVGHDPLLEKRAYWDIGGTGAKADARAIWIVQFVGKEIRVLDYRETVGQPLAADVEWMRSSGYKGITCVLPHDGETNDRVHDVSYESYLRKAEFPVVVIPNQGKGAATKRVEAVRRILPNCWFNENTTEPGLDALGWYHERKDEERNVGLGPEHDWASHGADAFGLMAVAYEAHSAKRNPVPKFRARKVV